MSKLEIVQNLAYDVRMRHGISCEEAGWLCYLSESEYARIERGKYADEVQAVRCLELFILKAELVSKRIDEDSVIDRMLKA